MGAARSPAEALRACLNNIVCIAVGGNYHCEIDLERLIVDVTPRRVQHEGPGKKDRSPSRYLASRSPKHFSTHAGPKALRYIDYSLFIGSSYIHTLLQALPCNYMRRMKSRVREAASPCHRLDLVLGSGHILPGYAVVEALVFYRRDAEAENCHNWVEYHTWAEYHT